MPSEHTAKYVEIMDIYQCHTQGFFGAYQHIYLLHIWVKLEAPTVLSGAIRNFVRIQSMQIGLKYTSQPGLRSFEPCPKTFVLIICVSIFSDTKIRLDATLFILNFSLSHCYIYQILLLSSTMRLMTSPRQSKWLFMLLLKNIILESFQSATNQSDLSYMFQT